MTLIADNLQVVHDRMTAAALAAGRDPESIRLLAVSKTFATEAILEAIQAGQKAFGENYLQEALDKISVVETMTDKMPIEWHFIGPIQSNKTRQIAEHFDWVHTVDRIKIAQRLSEQRPEALPALNICLQVNISAEDSKSGLSPEQVAALAHDVACLPRLHLRGLMAIPAISDDSEEQRSAFRQLRLLEQQLQHEGLMLDTLSMGMSADMAAAIAEGATIVRIGTAIFGRR